MSVMKEPALALEPAKCDPNVSAKGIDSHPWYARYVLGVLLLAYVFSFIDRQILSLMVGPIRRDLGISDFQLSLLQGSAFALFYSVMAFPIAYLADRGNRRTIIAAGIALWSLATMGCGLVRSFGPLFLLRMGVGVGEAGLLPPGYSLLSDYFPASRLARASAIFMLGVSVGGGIGYLVGGLLMQAVTNGSAIDWPLVGVLLPWQTVFIIVGMPGLLVALMMYGIKEPARRGALRDDMGQVRTISTAVMMRYMLAHWQIYIAYPLGTALLGVFSYGLMAWYPTFLIRTYGFTIAEAGTYFGLAYLIFGTLGTYFGARWAEALRHRYPDVHIRFIMLTGLALTVPGVLGPLMPSAPLALLVLIPTIFLKCSYYGSSSAALQLVTPNQMRAQAGAMQIFFGNIIGMTVGASAVAILTDFVFQNDNDIRYSLACVAAFACPSGALVLYYCLKPYSKALEEAGKRDQSDSLQA